MMTYQNLILKITHNISGELSLVQRLHEFDPWGKKVSERYYNHWMKKEWEFGIKNGINQLFDDLYQLGQKSTNPYFWQNLNVNFEFEQNHPIGIVCAWVTQEGSLTHVFAFKHIQDMDAWNVKYKVQITYMIFEGGRLVHEQILKNHKEILAFMSNIEAVDQFGFKREEPIKLQYETYWLLCNNGNISLSENVQNELFVPRKP